jgi:hypothetical protein
MVFGTRSLSGWSLAGSQGAFAQQGSAAAGVLGTSSTIAAAVASAVVVHPRPDFRFIAVPSVCSADRRVAI